MKSACIKTQTAVLMAFLACFAGFIGGVVYSGFQPDSPMPVEHTGMHQSPVRPTDISADMRDQIRIVENESLTQPDNPELWTHLANLYYETDQYQKAIDAYNKSLSYHPDNADVLTDLGVMYRKAGNPDKALECFDKAIAVNPAHEISLFNKGIVLMHDLKDIKGAVIAWEKLVDINPAAMAPNGESVDMMLQNLKKALDS